MSEESFPLQSDSYQTPKNVAVTVYKSGKSVEVIETHPEDKSVVVKFNIDGTESLKAWAFYGEIDPSSMKIDNGSKKIEISFTKKKSENWPHTEAQGDSTKPLYAKWSQVKFEEEEEKNEGLDKFLQKIYGNASEDARRAMNKSFIESGGTVLSTNWEEVGSKRVEPQPPGSNK